MKIALRFIGVIGFIVFAAGFVLTLLSPIHFEQAGRAFIQAQIETQVRETLAKSRQPPLEKAASLLAQRYQGEAAILRQQLNEGLPERIAAGIAAMQDLSCECRKLLARDIQQSFEWRIASLSEAQAQLGRLIQGKYVEVVQSLLRDLRIFTGANAAVFILLLIVSFLRGRTLAHLVLPSGLLLLATAVSAYFYLFEQNWFFTIIYNDYTGFGYVAYLSVVFLILCDIALNRARVTTEVCNSLLQAIGSAASLSPC